MGPLGDFVVTACQRSATAYTARLFTALGCACGHEAVFSVDTLRRGGWLIRRTGTLLWRFAPHRFLAAEEVDVGVTPPWPVGLRGDASWLAAPYLARLPARVVVLHQLRDPIAVIRSLVRIRMLRLWSPHTAFLLEHCPPARTGDWLTRLMVYWVEWNRKVAAASAVAGRRYFRFRVEDLTPALVEEIGVLIGCAFDPDRTRQEVAALPRDIHTRGEKAQDQYIRWDTLPSGPARRELEQAARRYGYEPS